MEAILSTLFGAVLGAVVVTSLGDLVKGSIFSAARKGCELQASPDEIAARDKHEAELVGK